MIEKSQNDAPKRHRVESPKHHSKTDQIPLDALGIHPLGNLYAFDANELKIHRSSSLGRLSRLSDTQLVDVLSYLDPVSLSQTGGCSHYMYAFTHHIDLWKQIYLMDWNGSEFSFSNDWRQTCIRREQSRRGQKTDYTYHRMPVRQVFSDLLYQSYLYASLDLKKEWLECEDIPRVSANELSVQQFQKTYEQPNTPVIITDVVSSWPACTLWNRENLLKRYGDTMFSCGHFDCRLSEYFAYSDAAEQGADDQPLYLFDKTFARCDKASELANEYTVPQYFAEDLFHVLGMAQGDVPPETMKDNSTDQTNDNNTNQQASVDITTSDTAQNDCTIATRPDYRWLIIGPRRSGSSFHKDPNATSAWNGVVQGSKRWIMYPPDVTPPGVHASTDGADVATPVSLAEWYLSFYDLHTRTKNRLQRQSHNNNNVTHVPMEGTLRAGELLFVPRGWWHCAMNLERDTIAITQNYISSVGLPATMHFLKNKPDQISGVPRPLRAQIHSKFLSTLEAKLPEVYASFISHEKQMRERIAEQRKRQGVLIAAEGWSEILQRASSDSTEGEKVNNTQPHHTKDNSQSDLISEKYSERKSDDADHSSSKATFSFSFFPQS